MAKKFAGGRWRRWVKEQRRKEKQILKWAQSNQNQTGQGRKTIDIGGILVQVAT